MDPQSPTCDLPSRFRHTEIAREPRTCETHGVFESICTQIEPRPVRNPAHIGIDDVAYLFGPRWSSCPTCDAELQREVDERDAVIRGGMTERQRAFLMRIREANIPQRFAEATVWNWHHSMDQQHRVWSWARDYCNAYEIVIETGRCGVLLGSTGTGKTHLAIGVLRHILEKGGTGYYTTAIDMLGRIKATYSRGSDESETKVVDMLTSVDLLVVDEVGRQLDTSYEVSQLFRVLDRRSSNLRPTLIVSNLSKLALAEFLGDALLDRLREGGGALLVFDWASQRSTRKPKTEASA